MKNTTRSIYLDSLFWYFDGGIIQMYIDGVIMLNSTTSNVLVFAGRADMVYGPRVFAE